MRCSTEEEHTITGAHTCTDVQQRHTCTDVQQRHTCYLTRHRCTTRYASLKVCQSYHPNTYLMVINKYNAIQLNCYFVSQIFNCCQFIGLYQHCPHPPLSPSTEALYGDEAHTEYEEVEDIDDLFRMQCKQIFIGMVTMQYQAKIDMVSTSP